MKRRMKVLIGYDGSSYADIAIDDLRGAGLPSALDALVVSVGEAPVVPPLASDHGKQTFAGERAISILNHADTHISQALAKAEDEACAGARLLEMYFPNWQVRSAAVGGSPEAELIQKAHVWGADLIVVGSQGRSAVGRFLFGSVSLEVAMDAPCSVRIGREFSRNNKVQRIVVGLDGFAGSERAIKHVLKRTWPEGTELRIIAVDDGHSPIKMADVIPPQQKPVQFERVPGLKVFAEIKKGDPAAILMAEACEWKADSIFIGARGFGNTAADSRNNVSTQLATNAGCSVEIVR